MKEHNMRRTLRIDIEIQDPAEPNSLGMLVDAISDYVAKEWNANVTANVIYDSDEDPNYQKLYNEGTPIRVIDEDGSVSWEGRTPDDR
jgi:hypothetical protein